jgi:hypothetical protein
MCELTDALLWIQLVAERSASKRRALGVAITSLRYNNVEGSAFGLRRAKGSVKANEWFSEIKGTIQFNQTKSSVKSKASDEIREKGEKTERLSAEC